MEYQTLQIQYEKIYSYFKTTTEPFDSLEWNGKILEVWNENKIIEKYSLKDLRTISCLGNNIRAKR
jgi:hypothetical protein